ncbi:hypothetical protein [Cellulomonas cellasea]|uniref:Uncharacterized protein n=2 Tax=Cellulomonas cellasea TaxID=43670 RepID=A0A0A0B3D4_9CELL|nr:hypothetical protein [Cellulomonas cellasea]KGM00658.1 hypothetical protein Q760_06925 [Cellulomonas cellasea DSM 20118]GEA88051.1 hypothetical protein CCE01nite_20000 [Cellulomonas cellasea]
MNDDLAAALRGFADQERHVAAASAPDPTLESGALARRVTRRRAVRAGATAVASLAVVGGIAVGVQAWDTAPQPPAVPVPAPTTPTPTPAPTTPTPTPSPSPTPTAPPAPPPTPTFRDAEPMAPGMLETSGAGWLLVRYQPFADASTASSPAQVYLLSPDGRPYLVPTPLDLEDTYVLDWAPGSTRALVGRGTGTAWVADLLTGERGPDLATPSVGRAMLHDSSGDVLDTQAAGGIVLRRVAPDGSVLAESPGFERHYGSAALLPSPDTAFVVLNDVAGPRALRTDRLTAIAMAAPYPDLPAACRAWMWVGPAKVLHECSVDGSGPFAVGAESEFWLVPVGGDQPRRLADMPAATSLGGMWRVGDRLVAGTFGPRESQARWWDVTDGRATPLSAGGAPGLRVAGVRGGELVATERPRPVGDEPTVDALVAVDPVTGVVRRLVEGEPGRSSAFGVAPEIVASAPQTEIGD